MVGEGREVIYMYCFLSRTFIQRSILQWPSITSQMFFDFSNNMLFSLSSLLYFFSSKASKQTHLWSLTMGYSAWRNISVYSGDLHVTVVFISVEPVKGFAFHQEIHQIRPWWGFGGFGVGTWVKAVLKDLLRSSANRVFDFNYHTSILKNTNLAFWTEGIRTSSRGGRQNFMQQDQFIYLFQSEARSNALCNIPSQGGGGMWKRDQHSFFFFQSSAWHPPTLYLPNRVCFSHTYVFFFFEFTEDSHVTTTHRRFATFWSKLSLS